MKFDVAIVGAGIGGLAHALEAARRGYRVVVFERGQQAQGASIRNFGMILPVGMAPGEMHEWAMNGRQTWLDIAAKADIWHEPVGALIPAYQLDELAVLAEFSRQAPALGYPCQLLRPGEVLARSPSLNPQGLSGGLWSATEVILDPRQAIARLPDYLVQEYGVVVKWGTAVTAIQLPHIEAGGQTWYAERAIVCNGTDFETLYPDLFRESGLTRCKLQMMRTEAQPNGWRLGPMLAFALSLTHYPAFAICSSLPDLKARLTAELPDFYRWGIHVMACQNGLGEVVIGDSHEYGLTLSPFDRPEIDDLILDYLQGVLHLPSYQIAERWHGVYAKQPEQAVFSAEPESHVHVVSLGGVGMTLGFGLAQELFENRFS